MHDCVAVSNRHVNIDSCEHIAYVLSMNIRSAEKGIWAPGIDGEAKIDTCRFLESGADCRIGNDLVNHNRGGHISVGRSRHLNTISADSKLQRSADVGTDDKDLASPVVRIVLASKAIARVTISVVGGMTAGLRRRGDRPTRHGNEVRLEQGEYLLAVVWDIRTIDDMRDLSLFVDNEGDTINYPHRGHYAAKQAATRDAISSRGCHIGVSKQGKVEMILLREALV